MRTTMNSRQPNLIKFCMCTTTWAQRPYYYFGARRSDWNTRASFISTIDCYAPAMRVSHHLRVDLVLCASSRGFLNGHYSKTQVIKIIQVFYHGYALRCAPATNGLMRTTANSHWKFLLVAILHLPFIHPSAQIPTNHSALQYEQDSKHCVLIIIMQAYPTTMPSEHSITSSFIHRTEKRIRLQAVSSTS